MNLDRCVELLNSSAENRQTMKEVIGLAVCSMLLNVFRNSEKWGFAMVELDHQDPSTIEYEEGLQQRIEGLIADAMNHSILKGLVDKETLGKELTSEVLRYSRIRYMTNLPLAFDFERDRPRPTIPA